MTRRSARAPADPPPSSTAPGFAPHGHPLRHLHAGDLRGSPPAPTTTSPALAPAIASARSSRRRDHGRPADDRSDRVATRPDPVHAGQRVRAPPASARTCNPSSRSTHSRASSTAVDSRERREDPLGRVGQVDRRTRFRPRPPCTECRASPHTANGREPWIASAFAFTQAPASRRTRAWIVRDRAVGLGTDVQQQVAALGDHLGEHRDELRRASGGRRRAPPG